MNTNIYNLPAAEEDELHAKKMAYYRKWQEEKLTAAVDYLRAAESPREETRRFLKIKEKFGKQFIALLRKRI